MVYEYTYDEEKQEMRVNCIGSIYEPSIEDSIIDNLLEVKKPVRIILAETREYEYDFPETDLLLEIALAIDRILRSKIISLKNISSKDCEKHVPERYARIQNIFNEIKYDPVQAYKKLIREIRHAKIMAKKEEDHAECYETYVQKTLVPIKEILDGCKLIQMAKPNIADITDRSFYRKIFHPTIRPNFMYTRYISIPPANAELIDRYSLDNAEVEIYKLEGKTRKLYHIVPPEFKLKEDEYMLLDTARRYLARHKPREAELAEPMRIRQNLYNIGLDMLRDLVKERGVRITEERLQNLADILTRYTAGFGMLELILKDENIQDIAINSPIGKTPMFIFHGVHQECETNIIPSREDAESWATRFKLRSGRPLDEANPVLDTELDVPGGRARVAAITRTLSPYGLGFAFRRHRDKPWTYPLFINNKMISAFGAALMWFIIDGARTVLIAGTRSSGKTSFLGASMIQIMPKLRIVSVEDSVTGDANIVVKRNGKFERTSVGELIDALLKNYEHEILDGREVLHGNPEEIRVFSMNSEGKVELKPVKSFIRHKVNKDIYLVTTRTGRKIKVTGDHSLFTLGESGNIRTVKTKDLKPGDFLVTPRILPVHNKPTESIDLLDHLDKLEPYFLTGKGIKEFIYNNKDVIKTVVKKMNYSKSALLHWKRGGIIPLRVLKRLKWKKSDFKNAKIKCSRHSNKLPTKITLDTDFLTFVGLWLADGCYDSNSVIVSVTDNETREVVRNVAKRFGISVKMHSDEFSLILNSKVLKSVMKDVLKLEGNAYTKRIPTWIFDLSKEQIAPLLRGIFSGDGYLAKSEVGLSLVSENMLKDIQTLLLYFGVIGRINRKNTTDKTYSCRISSIKTLKPFLENIGFLQKEREEKLKVLCSKTSTHDTTDVIPLSLEFKRTIAETYDDFNTHDYIARNNNIGRENLGRIVTDFEDDSVTEILERLANSDIFWDQVRSVKKLKTKDVYVYDFSVPENENFICENILAHNTLELPIEQMVALGYNIERLKSRSVITRIETELAAEEALRTALRLGDSCLIIGEVRSVEAKALYEAMRIGALANVVAGTIHGDSAYGVFDRVVNDLGVPPTSFKATDIILICNMLKTPDGLHSFRRVVEITEVRKHWKTDPMDEMGFVNLMEYSAKDDTLKSSKTLLAGESVILNDIASRVKEWRGNWDAVWNNIKLREKILSTLVEYSKKKPDLLEAPMVIQSNSHFHLISDEVKEELGYLDNNAIYERWLNWLKSVV
jgi:type IV secretory pathway ATPase VirB11/archaellum biosynthesis ATPase